MTRRSIRTIAALLPVAPLESIYLEGVGEVFSGKFKIGVDGTFISLPANAEAIEVGER